MDPETLKDELAKRELLAPLQGALRNEAPVPQAQVDAGWDLLTRAISNQLGDTGVEGVGGGRVDARTLSGVFKTQTLRRDVLVDGSSLVRGRDKPEQSEISGGKRMANLGLYFGRFGHSGNGLGSGMLRRWIASSAIALVLAIAVVLVQPTRQIPVGITRMYVTRSGQQATVTASDGTQFILSQNTTLRLFDFAAHTRTVTVDGEAYINVAHASGLPFIVQSGNINVQVLGTGFLIRHDGGARTRVAVVDGKVRLITKSKHGVGVTLTAGQIGDVIDSTVYVSSVDGLNPRTEWTQEQLVFHDTPLSTILAKLSQWYGYQFRVSDSTLARKTLTLGVSTHSSMKALAEIERVLHVNISVVGDTVTLIPQPSKRINGTSRLSAYDVWIPSKEAGR